MTSERSEIEALASEGLDYFEKAGDDGDKVYVRAIREVLARRLQPARVPEGHMLVRESMLRHWLRELNGIRNGNINPEDAAEHVHASIAAVLAAAPAAEGDHSCRNCLGVDPASCMFNPAPESREADHSPGAGNMVTESGQREGVEALVEKLAEEIGNAVMEDEQTEGCDISGGLFGPKFSAIIRRLASAPQPTQRGGEGVGDA